MEKMTDTQRHAMKIRRFDVACESKGCDYVERLVGRGAYSSMLCARDAQLRQQPPAIVASFLVDADSRFGAHIDNKWADLSQVLKHFA